MRQTLRRRGQCAKIGNTPTRGYKSVREAERARVLHLLEKAGKIKDLQEEVRFELIPAIGQATDGTLVEIYNGEESKKKGLRCIQRKCEYFADFAYIDTETGKYIVEDAKGWAMEDYKIKKKLMLWVHGIRVKEV